MKKRILLIPSIMISVSFVITSCGSESNKEKKEEKVIEKVEPLKIGDKHEGGYIFFLDFEGKHGKICAPHFEGDLKRVSRNEAIESAKNLSLNGFSDWRIPSIDELELIKSVGDQKSLLFNYAGYWATDIKKTDWGFDYFYYDLMGTKDYGSDIYPSDLDRKLNYRVIRDF